MRELSISEVQSVSGGYGTLGPGGGSDPGNQLTDYGVNSGGLRFTSAETRGNILSTLGVLGAGIPGAIGRIAAGAGITGIWIK